MTILLSLAFAMAAATVPATPADPAAHVITVAWRDKPPYHYTENGVEKGELLLRSKRAFADAGLAAHFVKMPNKRIWASFAARSPYFCSIGWYLLPERERLAQYSAAIYSDPPQIVLVAPSARKAVDAHATLAALLADPQLSIGRVDGLSYGPALDALMRTSVNQIQSRTVEPSSMMRMVAAGRFSMTFSDVEDWNYARAHDPSLAPIVRRDFPDMPPGLKRYVICTKDVPAESMAKLNRAIEALKPDARSDAKADSRQDPRPDARQVPKPEPRPDPARRH